MEKSLTRVYNFSPSMFVKPEDTLPGFIPTCQQVVLKKIGFDAEKRPLYNLLIGDGCRTMDALGYVVPVGTEVAFELGSKEVKEPKCACCGKDGVMSADNEDGEGGCKGECCW